MRIKNQRWITLHIILCFYISIQAQYTITPPQLPAIKYWLYSNEVGSYEDVYTGKDLIPKDGQKEFDACFSQLIRYPIEAYEQEIRGVTVLNIIIDSMGYSIDVRVLKSLSKECDESARRAFIEATRFGYAIMKIHGKAVSYRMEYPVLFWLN